MTFVVVSAILGPSFAYTTQIHAPAVLQNEDMGALTTMQLNLTAGNGAVSVLGPQAVGSSTLQSAQYAVQAASSYMGINALKYNFTYYIENSVNVSGPSGGLALALLATYAFKNEGIYNNFTVTGTITGNGTVGEIGGVTDKAQAAKQNGMDYMLVPAVQNGSSEDFLYYLSQQLYGIPLHEVSNLSQAVPYAGVPQHLTPSPLGINLTQHYNLSSLASAPLQCGNCNSSYFAQLANYTFGFVRNATEGIPQNFSQARSQLLGNLAQYESISSKGYLYTGADLAFVEYSEAYTLAHEGSFTVPSALSLASNVSNYCMLTSPPQLTSTNYEYVAGGELRQSLALANLQNAITAINNSQSTDDIISAIGMIAESQAWCGAANEMYGIASAIGGTPVYEPAGMKTDAQQLIKASSQYPGLYLEAAMLSYNQSEYSAALYAATYARAFGRPGPSNYSGPEQAQIAGLAQNSTNGIWPTEFSNSAMFYLQQAGLASNSSMSEGYVASAYSLVTLASGLSTMNAYISSHLQNGTSSNALSASSSGQLLALVSNQAEQIKSLTQEVDSLSTGIKYIAVLLVAVLFVALVVFVNTWWLLRAQKKAARRGRRQSA